MLSEKQFIDLIHTPSKWTINAALEGSIQSMDRVTSRTRSTRTIRTVRFAWSQIRATCGDISIVYRQLMEWSEGEPESYAIIENHGASCFITAGLEVLGENGRVLPKHEVLRIFKDEADVRFTNPDWDSLLSAS